MKVESATRTSDSASRATPTGLSHGLSNDHNTSRPRRPRSQSRRRNRCSQRARQGGARPVPVAGRPLLALLLKLSRPNSHPSRRLLPTATRSNGTLFIQSKASPWEKGKAKLQLSPACLHNINTPLKLREPQRFAQLDSRQCLGRNMGSVGDTCALLPSPTTLTHPPLEDSQIRSSSLHHLLQNTYGSLQATLTTPLDPLPPSSL